MRANKTGLRTADQTASKIETDEACPHAGCGTACLASPAVLINSKAYDAVMIAFNLMPLNRQTYKVT
jgi:NADH:ubiquinone oxidoreductase subunit E